jgi:hypothetical protein
MLKFIERAIQAWWPQLTNKVASQVSPKGGLLLSLQEMKEIAERKRQQILADAHAAAASGEGPQPWDRDWFQYQLCIESDISDISGTIGWHRTQDFLEVLDWALASPQGQRALALAGDDASPWQGVLEMIKELQRPLIESTHLMLLSHAEELDYTSEAQRELREAFHKLPGSLHNITREES